MASSESANPAVGGTAKKLRFLVPSALRAPAAPHFYVRRQDMSTSENRYLRRYTDIPSAVHILKTKEFTLLSPSTWDDRNDRHYMELYKDRKKLKTLLALCFSQAGETYHHWKIFSPGSSGVCIEFNKTELLDAVPKRGFRHDAVNYAYISKALEVGIKAEQLAFTKRHAFYAEDEYRILYGNKSRELLTANFRVPVSSINRLIFNPWIPDPLYKTMRELIKEIDGCSSIAVNKSRLIESEAWKELGNAAV